MLNIICKDILISISDFLSNKDKLKYEIALKSNEKFTYIYHLSLTESNKLTDKILTEDKFKYLETIEISNNEIKNLTNFKNLKCIISSNLKIQYSDNFKRLLFEKFWYSDTIIILINKNYSFTKIDKQILIINTLCRYYQFNLNLSSYLIDKNKNPIPSNFKMIFATATNSGQIIHNTSIKLIIKLSKYYKNLIQCVDVDLDVLHIDYIRPKNEKYIENFIDLLYFGKLNSLITCKNENLLNYLYTVSKFYMFDEIRDICTQIKILYTLI